MNINYSKDFSNSVNKLSGKYKNSVINMIKEVKQAASIEDITDCKKLKDFQNIYRIRIGSFRALFLLRVIDNTVFFEYLISRGEAYSKEYERKLRGKDKAL